jgi:hypothetical protein
MSIFSGSTGVTALYSGNTVVSAVYSGADLVYQKKNYSTVLFQSFIASTILGSTRSTSAFSIGAEGLNRKTIVIVQYAGGSNTTRITGGTIKNSSGTPLTTTMIISSPNNNFQSCAAFIADTPTGTTASIDFTLSIGTSGTTSVTVIRTTGFDGVSSGAALNPSTRPFTLSLGTTPNLSLVVGFAFAEGQAIAATRVWSDTPSGFCNITETNGYNEGSGFFSFGSLGYGFCNTETTSSSISFTSSDSSVTSNATCALAVRLT